MGEKELETWRNRILPSTEVETPNYILFRDNLHETSTVALEGLFAVTHAHLVDAEIQADMIATELQRRADGGTV